MLHLDIFVRDHECLLQFFSTPQRAYFFSLPRHQLEISYLKVFLELMTPVWNYFWILQWGGISYTSASAHLVKSWSKRSMATMALVQIMSLVTSFVILTDIFELYQTFKVVPASLENFLSASIVSTFTLTTFHS